VAAAGEYVPAARFFEKAGMWFTKRPKKPLNGQGGGAGDIVDLQKKCLEAGLPVSGTINELMERMARQRIKTKKMVSKDVQRECDLLGINSTYLTKVEMVRDLKDAATMNKFKNLSMKDVMFECTYRGLDSNGTREQLMARLSTA